MLLAALLRQKKSTLSLTRHNPNKKVNSIFISSLLSVRLKRERNFFFYVTTTTPQQMEFLVREFFSKCERIRTYTREMLNGKHPFCAVLACCDVAMTTAQRMKFSIKDFFSKCDHIRSFLRFL